MDKKEMLRMRRREQAVHAAMARTDETLSVLSGPEARRMPDMDGKVPDGWPGYTYKKRTFGHAALALVVAVGLLTGVALARAGWAVLGPVEHHLLYGNEADQIGAKWTGEPVVVPPGYLSDLKSASYYGSEAWEALSPVENADGSVTFHPESKEAFTDFVWSMRAEIDRLVKQYTDDEAFQGFVSGEIGLDYYSVEVTTQMLQDSLIDQEKTSVLLRQLKLHSMFYDASTDGETYVAVIFRNRNTGAVVLNMTM